MDLQTRKLTVIEFLTQLQDEKLFNKIENLIFGKNKKQEENFQKLSEQEIIKRAEKSNKDFKSGKIHSQEELELISSKW